MAKKTDIYEIWDRYQKSKDYMLKKQLLTRTEKNWLMYLGDQWKAVKDHEGMEDLPSMNFIKPTVKYKVSSIASTKVVAMYSDLNGERTVATGEMVLDPMNQTVVPEMVTTNEIVTKMNAIFDISWEKGKLQKQGKKMLRHAAVQGDSYLYWGEGGDTRKTPQVIHNTQMHLGDENITNIQEQPWLIIEERLDVQVVKELARAAGIEEQKIKELYPDGSKDENLLNKEEVKGKITSLLYMEKDPKTGIVSFGRCTKEIMYEPLHAIEQKKVTGESVGIGLTKYPIVSLIWEEKPNDARGVSEVEQLIPNQLELNKMLARRAISAKMTAFPRTAYDESSLANPEDLGKVGAALKLNGANAQSISSMIAYLSPQSMSPDAQQLCDELMSNSRTLAGASDAQLGNIDLSRVSGTAAQTVRDQQQLPLNEQQETYQDFVENIALLWCELWKVYYPEGIEWDGIKLTAEEILSVEPNVRVDIAEDTSLSKMAAQQEITNLFMNNKITMAEFAEAYPDHSTLPKDVLKKIVQTRQALQQQGMPLLNDDGTPINDMVGGGVNPGGMSGGSYQNLQSMLAQ